MSNNPLGQDTLCLQNKFRRILDHPCQQLAEYIVIKKPLSWRSTDSKRRYLSINNTEKCNIPRWVVDLGLFHAEKYHKYVNHSLNSKVVQVNLIVNGLKK